MKSLLLIILTLIIFNAQGQRPDKNKQLAEATDLIFTNPEKSVQISKDVFQRAEDYPTKIIALSKLVNAQMVLGDISQVIINCNKGITMSTENEDRINQIRFLSMLGNQYQQIDMMADAKRNLDKAENLINSGQLPKDLLFIQGNVYNVKGIVFKSELNCEYAIKYFDKALAVYDLLRDEDVMQTNRMLIKIQKAQCLEALGKSTEAEILYTDVLESKNIGLGYNRDFAALGLINIDLKNKKIDAAGKLLRSIKSNDLLKYDAELNSLYFQSMAQYYYLRKEYEQYIYYFNKFNQSLLIIDKSKKEMIQKLINDINADYVEKSRKNWIMDLSVIALIVSIFTALAIFLYRFSKKNVNS